MVDAAASEELAEITLEQQVLRELSTKSGSTKPQSSGGKRFNTPLNFNLADMINGHAVEVVAP